MDFFSNSLCLSISTQPILIPRGVSLKSALSDRSKSLYSDLEVNILYGSFVPFVTKSSIKTPIYPRDLGIINSLLDVVLSDAFIPAIIPCAAASSYPVVPFICPAKK